MTLLFIQNKQDKSKGVKIFTKEGTDLLTNEGVEGSFSESVLGGESVADICLSAHASVPQTNFKDKTNPNTYEGDFVVEVEGELVPYIFTEETLPLYFNEGDKSGTGVAFIKDEPSHEVTCVSESSRLIIKPGFKSGPITLHLAGEQVGVFDDIYSVSEFLTNNQQYGIVLNVFAGGSGSGSAQTECNFVNVSEKAIPVKIEVPNDHTYFEYYMNDTVVESDSDDLIYTLEFCLGPFNDLQSPHSYIAIDDNKREFKDIGNDMTVPGVTLNLVFPNGVHFSGFLASGRSGSEGMHPVDTIGMKAEELGYSVSYVHGLYADTINDGKPVPESFKHQVVVFRNYSNKKEKWVVDGTALLGVIDGMYDNGSLNYETNGEGRYEFELGPWYGG